MSDDGSGVGVAAAVIVPPVASNRAPAAVMRSMSQARPKPARVFTAKELKPPLRAKRKVSPLASVNNSRPGVAASFPLLKKE
jgi:hypothetical protein